MSIVDIFRVGATLFRRMDNQSILNSPNLLSGFPSVVPEPVSYCSVYCSSIRSSNKPMSQIIVNKHQSQKMTNLDKYSGGASTSKRTPLVASLTAFLNESTHSLLLTP